MSRDPAPLDTAIRIVTPENIAFPFQVAGPFRRLGAYVIDLVVRACLFAAAAFVLVIADLLTGVGGPLLLLAWFVLEWFYGGLFETLMNGRTPGKWATGLRVLTVHGRPINGMQAVLRNILRTADMTPALSLEVFGAPVAAYVIPTFLTGLAAMTLSDRFQRLGDLVCGTMVVVEERRWLAGLARLDDEAAERLAARLPGDFRVSPSLARALSTYVERRRQFTPGRRREVARHLARPLADRLRLPPPVDPDQLLCALYLKTFFPLNKPPGGERSDQEGREETALEAAGAARGGSR